MIDQGKSLESYAESIGVKLPRANAPASTLGMSSMIDQGISLESYAESIGVKLAKADAPAPTSWTGSPDPLAAAQAAGYSLAGHKQIAIEESLTWTIAVPTFSGSVLGQDISFSDQKVFEQTSTLGMSSMIDQGKSLESYAESIGVKLPRADAPASTLGM